MEGSMRHTDDDKRSNSTESGNNMKENLATGYRSWTPKSRDSSLRVRATCERTRHKNTPPLTPADANLDPLQSADDGASSTEVSEFSDISDRNFGTSICLWKPETVSCNTGILVLPCEISSQQALCVPSHKASDQENSSSFPQSQDSSSVTSSFQKCYTSSGTLNSTNLDSLIQSKETCDECGSYSENKSDNYSEIQLIPQHQQCLSEHFQKIGKNHGTNRPPDNWKDTQHTENNGNISLCHEKNVQKNSRITITGNSKIVQDRHRLNTDKSFTFVPSSWTIPKHFPLRPLGNLSSVSRFSFIVSSQSSSAVGNEGSKSPLKLLKKETDNFSTSQSHLRERRKKFSKKLESENCSARCICLFSCTEKRKEPSYHKFYRLQTALQLPGVSKQLPRVDSNLSDVCLANLHHNNLTLSASHLEARVNFHSDNICPQEEFQVKSDLNTDSLCAPYFEDSAKCSFQADSNDSDFDSNFKVTFVTPEKLETSAYSLNKSHNFSKPRSFSWCSENVSSERPSCRDNQQNVTVHSSIENTSLSTNKSHTGHRNILNAEFENSYKGGGHSRKISSGDGSNTLDTTYFLSTNISDCGEHEQQVNDDDCWDCKEINDWSGIKEVSQQDSDCTEGIIRNTFQGSNRYQRLLQFHRKNLIYKKSYSNNSDKCSLISPVFDSALVCKSNLSIPVCTWSPSIQVCKTRLSTSVCTSSISIPVCTSKSSLPISELSVLYSSPPSILITTTALDSASIDSVRQSSFPTFDKASTSGTKGSIKRRHSREKSELTETDESSLIPTQAHSLNLAFHENQVDSESGQFSKRISTAERKKLKVEFAQMEGDEKFTLDKCRGFGGGNLVVKGFSDPEDGENNVAMLRGSGSRLRHPRLSLLGKPINYRAHRRDIKYRRLQARIYNFLERPKSWGSWMYHFNVFVVVLLCLNLGVLSSMTEFESYLTEYAVYMEMSMLLWITAELGLRVWSAGCRSRYQGKSGRLKFLRRPLCVIDIILILASVSTLAVGYTQEHFYQAVLGGLRFFQILRMVRMDRKGSTWKLLGSVVWAHRQELVTTLYIGLLGLVFSSYFVYLAEKDEPRHDSEPKQHFNNSTSKPKFSNFADAIWWGVVTLCTVGYGDVVPATWGGKVIASFSAILGISFFALPAGILGSGFALKVQQQQRQKHLNRRRIPAANLIQCLWRCYAADVHSSSTATWKPHRIPCPSPTSERTFKNNTSFVSRFSTRRRDRSNTMSSLGSRDGLGSQTQSPMTARHHFRRSAISASEEEVTTVLDRSHLSLSGGTAENKFQLTSTHFRKENSVSSIGKESEEEADLSPKLTQLTEQHKRAIRAIRKIRYFVSRRQFREALRPYDVKDVIEQYSAGHIDMLGRIKNLQGRLDQILGRQGSKCKDVYESKICLASRIVKVERQVEDIETKLDVLVDMYKEDRKLLLHHFQLSQGGTATSGSAYPPPPPAPSSQFKPRPILIDKQFTSEPATPTGFLSSSNGRLQGKKPVIQRNLSDLSQRIKKRVTYRALHDPPSRAQSAANFTSSFPPSTLSTSSQIADATSPDEMSSTTISEITHNASIENMMSTNDISSSLTSDVSTVTADQRQDANSTSRSSPGPTSNLSTDDCYFFGNSVASAGLKEFLQQSYSLTPVNSPLVLVKTLSTLNEQRSLESDTILSCTSSTPPSPPPISAPAGTYCSLLKSQPKFPTAGLKKHFSPDLTHNRKKEVLNLSKIRSCPNSPTPTPLFASNSVTSSPPAVLGQPVDRMSQENKAPHSFCPPNHVISSKNVLT